MIDQQRVLDDFLHLVSIRCSTLDEREIGLGMAGPDDLEQRVEHGRAGPDRSEPGQAVTHPQPRLLGPTGQALQRPLLRNLISHVGSVMRSAERTAAQSSVSCGTGRSARRTTIS